MGGLIYALFYLWKGQIHGLEVIIDEQLFCKVTYAGIVAVWYTENTQV